MTKKQEQKLLNSAMDYLNKLSDIVDLIRKGELRSKKYDTMYLCDLSDHIKLCHLIIDKNYQEASRFLQSIDTVPRDTVPNNIFNYLCPQNK